MSEKKYKSGKAIDAEITKLLEAKKKMAEGKITVFLKTLMTEEMKNRLVNMEDSEIRSFSKTILSHFDKLCEMGQKEKEERASKVKVKKSEPSIIDEKGEIVLPTKNNISNQGQAESKTIPEKVQGVNQAMTVNHQY